ncbi:hypothetical protein DFQ13_116112 [Actinokineospora spheciospongiae]|nr:hypothetical protein DFQ13_116112 [Actinokineospora spheciospongiae]
MIPTQIIHPISVSVSYDEINMTVPKLYTLNSVTT